MNDQNILTLQHVRVFLRSWLLNLWLFLVCSFVFRAKYIVGTTEMLRQKVEGGEQWLLSLRKQSLEDAVLALCTLPGIGPKVAACIALFSLDQHHAIPVDTHVWQVHFSIINNFSPWFQFCIR